MWLRSLFGKKSQSSIMWSPREFFWLNYANYSDYGNYGGDFFKKQSQSRDHKAQTKGLRFFLTQLRQLQWLQQLRRRFSGKKPNHAITVITQSQKPRHHTLVLPLVSQVKVMSRQEVRNTARSFWRNTDARVWEIQAISFRGPSTLKQTPLDVKCNVQPMFNRFRNVGGVNG